MPRPGSTGTCPQPRACLKSRHLGNSHTSPMGPFLGGLSTFRAQELPSKDTPHRSLATQNLISRYLRLSTNWLRQTENRPPRGQSKRALWAQRREDSTGNPWPRLQGDPGLGLGGWERWEQSPTRPLYHSQKELSSYRRTPGQQTLRVALTSSRTG